jgi:hypothetical protein
MATDPLESNDQMLFLANRFKGSISRLSVPSRIRLMIGLDLNLAVELVTAIDPDMLLGDEKAGRLLYGTMGSGSG